MFPLRDHNPSTRTPFVTWALIATNVLIFFSYYGLFQSPAAIEIYFRTWGLVPAQASEIPVGFVTSMFLHGGILHLAGNMLFLWIFGDNLEDEMGHGKFLAFYLLSGIGAALFQVFAEPNSTVPMVGASGAIAGVMGGYLLLFPKAKVDILFIIVVIFRIVPVPAWLMLGLWFGLQLLNGTTATAGTGGVAYWAHAGGFLVGLALAVPLWRRLGGVAYWTATDGHPPHPEAAYRRVHSSVPVTGRTHRIKRTGSPWRTSRKPPHSRR